VGVGVNVSRSDTHTETVSHPYSSFRIFAGLMFAALQDWIPIKENAMSPCLPAGDSELYSHPSLDDFIEEFQALISPSVRDTVQKLGIKLIRYQDL